MQEVHAEMFENYCRKLEELEALKITAAIDKPIASLHQEDEVISSVQKLL